MIRSKDCNTFSYTVIVSAFIICFTGCSRMEIVEQDTVDGYYTGRPDLEFVEIPAGVYEMTVYKPRNTSVSDAAALNIIRDIKLDSFQMSAREITNKQYCMFLNELKNTGNDIQVVNDGKYLVVHGSVKEYTGTSIDYILKPTLPGYRKQLCGSGIYYSGGKFKVVKGQEDYPAVNVSASGAEAFAVYHGWTLPTEAQWEHAAHGGSPKAFGTSDGDIDPALANYDNTIGHSVKVGRYEPNGYGLYDMCGNAAEWCISQLRYQGIVEKSVGGGRYSVPKGGSWLSYEDACRIRSTDIHDRYFKYPFPRDAKDPYPLDLIRSIRPRNDNGFRVVTRVVNR